jgi:hypothetical protein
MTASLHAAQQPKATQMLPASFPVSSLPAPFVQATLIALNLPLDLTYRYAAAPEAGRASYDRDRLDRPVSQSPARPDSTPPGPSLTR